MSQTVTRAAAILNLIVEEPRTVGELAEEFGLHRTSMFRLLQSLEAVGFVRKRNDGRYVLGFRLIELGQRSMSTLDLRQAASTYARKLHRAVGNTVHIAALIDDSIIYVDKVEDSAGVRMYSRVGAAVLPQCSAVGKAILAGVSVSRRDQVLQHVSWERYTDTTLTTRKDLDRELDAVADRGWAQDDGEFEDFANCIAVPISSTAGVIGAISVTAVRMVQDLDALKQNLSLMQKTAADISRELG